MRIASLRSALVLAVVGAVTGMLVALAMNWWATRDGADRGWFAYSGTPRRYVDYLPSSPGTDWWALLWPAAAGGLLLGLVVAGALALAGRRVTLVRAG